MSAVSKKIVYLNQAHYSTASRDVQCRVNWTYGFRSNDVRRPLEVVRHGDCEKLIYFTANVVVVYWPLMNHQAHYLEHDREVIALAVAKSNGSTLVCTGELGERPAMHLWDSETLQNQGVI